MNEFEVLLSFLGAAVAFAGFTGVVSLIDRRAAHVSHQVTTFRIKSLISSALCVIVLSVLPIFLIAFKMPPPLAWRAGCAAMSVVGLAYLFLISRARSRLTGEQKEGLSTAQFNFMTPLGALTILGLIGAAFGQIPAMPMYLVGDFFFLLISATVFLRLVFMLDESAKNRTAPDPVVND